MQANALAVLAKAPVAGSVKTRLVPPLTHHQAAQLYRALLVDQLDHLRRFTGCDLCLVFAPASAEAEMRSLAPCEYRLYPQQGEDLGARMFAVFTQFYSLGYKNIVLIGGDLAPVPQNYFTQAFEFLDAPERRVVLGPTLDGGYYLIGANKPIAELFHDMTWSHDQVLVQTRARLVALNISHLVLPTWFDVDRPEDIRRLDSELTSDLEQAMPRTLAWLGRQGYRRGGASTS